MKKAVNFVNEYFFYMICFLLFLDSGGMVKFCFPVSGGVWQAVWLCGPHGGGCGGLCVHHIYASLAVHFVPSWIRILVSGIPKCMVRNFPLRKSCRRS